MFSNPENASKLAAFKTLGLPRRLGFERLSMRSKPDLDNAVSPHTVIHAARNSFHFGQFRHFLIVEDYLCSPGSRILLASKLTTFHTP
jgi:hypothetical protein